MKKIVMILVLILALSGCTPRFTIPDEPIYKEFSIVQLQDSVCMENADFVIFQSNVDKLWTHKNELRKLLEDIQSGMTAVEVDSDRIVAVWEIKPDK